MQSHNYLVFTSLVPRPPFNTPRGKGGLVNIVQHFCTSGGISMPQSDWLIWQLSHCTGFLATNHLALLITPLQTYLTHPLFTEAQQVTSISRIHSNSLPMVRMSPDPPFLFGVTLCNLSLSIFSLDRTESLTEQF